MSNALEDIIAPNVKLLAAEQEYHIWCFSLTAAAAIGLTGIVPILFIPFVSREDQAYKRKLKLMLSFSVGGLLGDVFLHLLPEAWNVVHRSGSSSHDHHLTLGLWVVSGISVFLAIEMILSFSGLIDKEESSLVDSKTGKKANNSETTINDYTCYNNGSLINQQDEVKSSVSVTGYLSVFANGVDNFTHGLAIAASFSAGVKIGMLTTFAILIHEVPHEFGDFAILMKSGFSRWRAVQAQMITAVVAIFGALVALLAETTDDVGSRTQWILPFSAGCFLYIAMSSILPDLLKEDDPRESVKQLLCITSGVMIMALVNRIEDISFIPFL